LIDYGKTPHARLGRGTNIKMIVWLASSSKPRIRTVTLENPNV
jgi:hypothetical protein